MTTTNIPPCPVCGVVPKLPLLCSCLAHTANKIDSNPTEWSALKFWGVLSDIALVGALRDLGIETVAQVRELVGIACDACDERTVRATNRAENLVPLLRRRAAEGEK